MSRLFSFLVIPALVLMATSGCEAPAEATDSKAVETTKSTKSEASEIG